MLEPRLSLKPLLSQGDALFQGYAFAFISRHMVVHMVLRKVHVYTAVCTQMHRMLMVHQDNQMTCS